MNGRIETAESCDLRHPNGLADPDGPIPPGTPIGRLGEIEWGWLVAAILFGWISTRAQQAAAEQLDAEQTIRMTGLDPDPWDAGAVAVASTQNRDRKNGDGVRGMARDPGTSRVNLAPRKNRSTHAVAGPTG